MTGWPPREERRPGEEVKREQREAVERASRTLGFRSRCERKGHDWFPPPQQRQFLPITSRCLRCGLDITTMPWGDCIGLGTNNLHPLRDHYRSDGSYQRHPLANGCRGPQ